MNDAGGGLSGSAGPAAEGVEPAPGEAGGGWVIPVPGPTKEERGIFRLLTRLRAVIAQFFGHARQRQAALAAQEAGPGVSAGPWPGSTVDVGRGRATWRPTVDPAGEPTLGHPSLAAIRTEPLRLLTQEACWKWGTSPNRGKIACQLLDALQSRVRRGGWRDLTWQDFFDWRDYLQWRKDFAAVCGPGVVSFQFHDFARPVLRADGPAVFRSAAFVVLRADGSAVRLDPLSIKFTTFGRLEDWLQCARAPEPWVDTPKFEMSHAEAMDFLQKAWVSFHRRRGGVFARLLPVSEFPWDRYMDKPCFKVPLVGETVVRFGLAKYGARTRRSLWRACFFGGTDTGASFTLVALGDGMEFIQGAAEVVFDE